MSSIEELEFQMPPNYNFVLTNLKKQGRVSSDCMENNNNNLKNSFKNIKVYLQHWSKSVLNFVQS